MTRLELGNDRSDGHMSCRRKCFSEYCNLCGTWYRSTSTVYDGGVNLSQVILGLVPVEVHLYLHFALGDIVVHSTATPGSAV